MRLIKLGFLLLILCLVFAGCKTYKNIPYFADLPDSARATILNAPYQQLVIQSDDLLNINIQTIDPIGNTIFNQNVTSSLSGSNSPSGSSGYSSGGASVNPQGFGGNLVDKNGEVELPMLGKIYLRGLTTNQARDTIQNRAAYFYKMPTVNVRFANLKVNILGEVQKPGTYIMPNEKNTIFDALGLAGDLTIFGKRENVLLIRDSAGKSNLIRFSLNSKKLLHEDYFYLKQNDVIYVEPTRAKIASLDAEKSRNYALGASILTVLIILATRVN